jgi:hypothetical protein
MNTENIKEIAKKTALEFLRNPEMLHEVCTPDFTAYHLWGDKIEGIESAIAMLKQLTYPPRVVIHDCFAEGDRVAIRFSVYFSNESGEEMARNEISILRFEEDKIAEWWVAFDRKIEEEFWRTASG